MALAARWADGSGPPSGARASQQTGASPGYTIYGDLRRRETVTLATVLHAKGVAVELVEQTASLALSLASRAGSEEGPYLRTPEGFVLAELHAILELIERVHPEPALVPLRPVRRTCLRLLEDWLELWLPRWPRRSWRTLERLGDHLAAAGFLLGPKASRADFLLAAWLETEVLPHEHARRHLTARAPRLVTMGDALLSASASAAPSDGAAGEDDVIPISLLAILEEIASDYHVYLARNHQALKDQESFVRIDLGLGLRSLPVQPVAERRRIEIGREITAQDRRARRRVVEVLEPMGAWHVLTLPPVLAELDPADPRSL